MSDFLRLQVRIEEKTGESASGYPRWETGATLDLLVPRSEAWEIYRWTIERLATPQIRIELDGMP